MTSFRSQRVGDLLKADISDILRTRIKDPRIGFITVTDVVMTPDLRMAKVYVSVLGDDNQRKNTLRGLESARTFIQNELGPRLSLRFMPELRFYIDTSLEYGARIETLINQIHRKSE